MLDIAGVGSRDRDFPSTESTSSVVQGESGV